MRIWGQRSRSFETAKSGTDGAKIDLEKGKLSRDADSMISSNGTQLETRSSALPRNSLQSGSELLSTPQYTSFSIGRMRPSITATRIGATGLAGFTLFGVVSAEADAQTLERASEAFANQDVFSVEVQSKRDENRSETLRVISESTPLIQLDDVFNEAADPETPPEIPAHISEWVAHGTDPGNYYCEHAFYTGTRLANELDSSVLRNDENEPLVGFMHVPNDRWSSKPVDFEAPQSERHERTRDLVGAAISGYLDAAKVDIGEGDTFRILLTGYGPFGGTTNNATADFVGHKENLDAAMQSAFGDDLLESRGKHLEDADGGAIFEYRIASGSTERLVQIRTLSLGVNDDALDPDFAASIPTALTDFDAQALLSMGVHGRSNYALENHADNGGLRGDADEPQHVWGAQPTHNMAPNYSLARAIASGISP